MGEHALVFGPELTAGRLIARLKALGLQVSQAKEWGIHSGETAVIRAGLEKFAQAHPGGIVHPGTSAYADRIEIPLLCQEFGLTYLGPSPRALNAWSNRFQFLHRAEELAIPHLRMGLDPVHSIREVRKWVANNAPSYPFLVKAAKGRGIFGSTLVQDEEDLEDRLPIWLEQLQNRTADIILYFERYREGMRRFTLPFCRFKDGRFVEFPMIDSSLQYSFNRWVEISPPRRISDEARNLISQFAQKMAEETAFLGVGLVEFLVDGSHVFLEEGTPHLNMAYHLWESMTKTHAVDWQLAAAGLMAPPNLAFNTGVALALRVDAEDPFRAIPQVGKILESEKQSEMDLDLSQNLDGPVALLYVRGNEWSDVVKNAVLSLQQIWISGELQTNERFLFELLSHPWFKEGVFHTQFLDEEFIPQIAPPPNLVQWACFLAAQIFPNAKKWTAHNKRWIVGTQEPVWVDGPHYFETASNLRGVKGKITLPEDKLKTVRVCIYPISEGFYRARLGSWSFTLRGETEPVTTPRLYAQVSGNLYFKPVREGEVVPAHRPVLLIESQGVLVTHAVPVDVRIKEWKVGYRGPVQIGQELAELEVIR